MISLVRFHVHEGQSLIEPLVLDMGCDSGNMLVTMRVTLETYKKFIISIWVNNLRFNRRKTITCGPETLEHKFGRKGINFSSHGKLS
ncbi:hypothetical protein RND71_036841 [Anisodus tanguticus]|uniref:Uncharacterized protein n=1 Tax=Anisodus tanguticus TaxID=243964 RepID=A0AAE1UUI8_9SOLA|nr:hypothetical protein RND71_036841 [Anisodus tanguticus]